MTNDMKTLKELFLWDPFTNKKARIVGVNTVGECLLLYTATAEQRKENIATCHRIRSGECERSEVPNYEKDVVK